MVPTPQVKPRYWKRFKFLRDFVRESANRKPDDPIDTQPFLLDPTSANMPSTFEITFIQDGIRYQYGLSVDRKRVWTEYLYASPKGRTVPYFQRAWNKDTHKEEYYLDHHSKAKTKKSAR